MKRRRRILRAAIVCGALLVAACSGSSKRSDPCPNVLILKEAGRLVDFVEGPGRDLTDVRFQARIIDFRGNCVNVDGKTVATMYVAFGIERGPANAKRTADFEYFVAIPKFHPRPEGKQRFRVAVRFEGNQTRIIYRDRVKVTIPLKEGEYAPGYDVFLGLQLTPDQLEYNRTRRRL